MALIKFSNEGQASLTTRRSLISSFTSPCDISDQSCVNKLANILLPHVFTGIPNLDVTSTDPLFIEEIVGDISILKYKFFNSTFIGFNNCEVSNLQLDKEFTKVIYDLICPHFTMDGKYEIKGRLILLPIEGKGDSHMNTEKYKVNVDSDLKTFMGKDGKIHAQIKNFKLKCEALEPLYFDFKNLFNGQKDLSDAVHKFAHENWREVTELVQDPVFYAIMRKNIANTNKYLKHVPLEEIFSI
ncbi:protein takeout-like [Nymphalis io]|uniref:protein takeout-like n=1 Tax=Inachis io TaxID=171585 RepID=UPI002169DE21|nr:protein takeout-like [Nymphalis io]